MFLDRWFPEVRFNIDDGYLEGLARGFKAGILTRTDYLNLVQCETIDGKKSSYFERWLKALLTESGITSGHATYFVNYRFETASAKHRLWKLPRE